MAELTTIEGLVFHFNAGAVTAVADHDADTLQAVTTVYGVTDGQLRIGESVGGFLRRIGVAGSFAKLTRVNGTFIWVNSGAVTAVRASDPDEYPASARALVSVGTLTQAVRETVAEVMRVVNAHGGKL